MLQRNISGLISMLALNNKQLRAQNFTLTCGQGILRFLRFIFLRGDKELELLDELLVEPVDTEEDERSRFWLFISLNDDSAWCVSNASLVSLWKTPGSWLSGCFLDSDNLLWSVARSVSEFEYSITLHEFGEVHFLTMIKIQILPFSNWFESDDSAPKGFASDISEFVAEWESESSLERFVNLLPSMRTGLQNIVGTTKLLILSLSSSMSSLSDISLSSSSHTMLPNSLVSLFPSPSQLLPLLLGECFDDDGANAAMKNKSKRKIKIPSHYRSSVSNEKGTLPFSKLSRVIKWSLLVSSCS